MSGKSRRLLNFLKEIVEQLRDLLELKRLLIGREIVENW